MVTPAMPANTTAAANRVHTSRLSSKHQRDGGQQAGQRDRQRGSGQTRAARIVGRRRGEVLGAQWHTGLLRRCRCRSGVSICATIGLPPVAISRRAAVGPERDAAVDVPVADRVAQRGLAGVVGDRERAGSVLLEDVGDLPAGRLRARRADRHVVRLGAGRRSANAIATIASTTVSTTTIPVARIAAGGSWHG